jgi:hypothetical protein
LKLETKMTISLYAICYNPTGRMACCPVTVTENKRDLNLRLFLKFINFFQLPHESITVGPHGWMHGVSPMDGW